VWKQTLPYAAHIAVRRNGGLIVLLRWILRNNFEMFVSGVSQDVPHKRRYDSQELF